MSIASEPGRRWWRPRGHWQRWVFPSVWLFYLLQTVGGVAKYSSGAGALLGYVIVVAFAILYITTLPVGFAVSGKPPYGRLVVMLGLVVVESFFAHQDAFVMCVYIAVVLIAALGRWGFPAVAVLTAVVVFIPPLIPSWHAGIDYDMAVTMPLVASAMFGFFLLVRNNRALGEARAEVARLAAENERTRIARDLHDLLGHSLTAITVKAGLARRLSGIDPARAAQEIAEVEALTRSTLADVRAAVAGYREVTLSGELATAREVLRAAGIASHTPHSVDSVLAGYTEVFGWVLREGVTNVVRHSRATTCSVTVGADWLEITDDGRGGPGVDGNGLDGLRERVHALGGTLTAQPGGMGPGAGWTVRVQMPAVPWQPSAITAQTSPFAPMQSFTP